MGLFLPGPGWSLGDAARLRPAGVPVVATRYQGVSHGFLLLGARCPPGTNRAALSQVVDTVHMAPHRRSW
ncbi:hypothetical protein ABZX88_24470 [Kitasatospora aureofaciens]|uniref:hypothetical protein n=1 Tax=Kitasatospora aureofaciens TaxID=1894 RepID=UPI0033AB33A2